MVVSSTHNTYYGQQSYFLFYVSEPPPPTRGHPHRAHGDVTVTSTNEKYGCKSMWNKMKKKTDQAKGTDFIAVYNHMVT